MEEEKTTVEEILEAEVIEEKPKLATRIKDGIVSGGQKMSKFVKEHSEEIKVLAPVVIAVAGGAVKIAFKLISKDRAHREQALKELYCYDRSLGHYWKLSHALSTDEWREVNKRKKLGETLGDILWDIGALD